MHPCCGVQTILAQMSTEQVTGACKTSSSSPNARLIHLDLNHFQFLITGDQPLAAECQTVQIFEHAQSGY